jgi:hypothetical protein
MATMRTGGRLLAAAASLVIAAGMVYAQDKEPRPVPPDPAPTTSSTAASLAAAASSPLPGPAPAGTPSVADRAQAELMAANAPTAAQDFQLELPPGHASEQGLQIHTIWAARAISMMFLDITTIGGFRQDALRWHPEGLAIDVMIPNYNTPEGIELGNQIAGFALANAKRWGVLHVIWRQGFYPGIGAPSWTADYGNETANHFDHVHIATDGGGYPSGREQYYIGSMTVAPPG